MPVLTRSHLFQFVIVWSTLGYPLLSLVTTALGLPNTNFSIFFRMLAAAAALLLLLGRQRPANRAAVFVFLVFWTAYFARLSITTALDPRSLARPVDFYWTWSFGVCFLPTLAALLTFDSEAVKRLRSPLLVFTIIALALALIFGTTKYIGLDETIVDINRLNIESINPISLGHLGVSGILLGIAALMSAEPWGRLRGRIRALGIAAICIGGIIVILANSRGPLLAMIACIGLLIFAGARRKRTYVFGTIFLVLAVLVATLQQGAIFSETGLVWRFQALLMGIDPSAAGRTVAFQGAFEQFVESPIFGDSIEERITQFYPHNLALEALMATGIVGGLPFAVLTLWTVGRAWNLVRQGSSHMWLGVLAVQYVVAGMFSGAIYTSGSVWMLMALTLSAPFYNRLQRGRFAIDPRRFHPARPLGQEGTVDLTSRGDWRAPGRAEVAAGGQGDRRRDDGGRA